MFIIIKSEIDYFKFLIAIILFLPLLFTLSAINDVSVFTRITFLQKYFWSIIIGLGIYALVFIIWSIRKKELRERKHVLLPVTINHTSISRLIFGIAPFVLSGFYIEVIKEFLPKKQLIFIDRIEGQLGMMFIALVGVDLVINIWFQLEHKKYNKRIFYSFIFVVTLILASAIVIYLVSIKYIPPLSFGGEEIQFFIWGILLSIINTIVYTKRKSFLG